MKKILKKTSFFEFQKDFFIAAALFIALGYTEQFFLLLLSVTVHELTHVLTARLYGCKTTRVIFTALGETAVVKNIDCLMLYKKIITLLAGPAANIIIGLCIIVVAGKANQFASINFSLAVFNLLPVYPLDGGRILQNIMGEAIGVINSHRLMRKTGKIICRLLMLPGLVQVALYPFNISIICICLYILKINEKQYLLNVYEFYRVKLLNLKPRPAPDTQKILKSSRLVVSYDLPVSDLIARLSLNRFYFFSVIKHNSVVYELDELGLMEYISVHGINKTVGKLCEDLLCK